MLTLQLSQDKAPYRGKAKCLQVFSNAEVTKISPLIGPLLRHSCEGWSRSHFTLKANEALNIFNLGWPIKGLKLLNERMEETQFRRFPSQGRKYQAMSIILSMKETGEDPVCFTPLTTTFSTAVRPVTTMPFKPSVAYATLAERKWKPPPFNHSSIREAKATTGLSLSKEVKGLQAIFFHGITILQYWSHSTNKTTGLQGN